MDAGVQNRIEQLKKLAAKQKRQQSGSAAQAQPANDLPLSNHLDQFFDGPAANPNPAKVK
jgi:hypothetical protein